MLFLEINLIYLGFTFCIIFSFLFLFGEGGDEPSLAAEEAERIL